MNSENKIKKKLNQYSSTVSEIKQLKDRIDDLQDRKTSIKGMSFDSIPSASGNSDKIADLICQIDLLERQYVDKLSKLYRQQEEVEELLESLDGKEREIIRKRYMECKPWETICFEMNYSWRQMHRFHNYILVKLELARRV